MTVPARGTTPPEPASAADPVTSAALDPTGDLREAVGDCVHCGFCLPACPTYQLWGEEMDSPRGRIHLMSQILDGAPVTRAAMDHLDRCLGCMACVPACPSGVHYDRLIEGARTWIDDPAAAQPPPERRTSRERAMQAAIFATFPYPRRLRLLTGPLRAVQRARLDRLIGGSELVQRVAPAVASSLRLAPRAGRRAKLPERIPAAGQRRAVVGILTGCVQQVFFPQVNAATARVLAAEGCDVIVPRGQACCGALSLHSGRATEAAGFARAAISAFEDAGVDAIVVNSAGCGSAMKDYQRLLAGQQARGEGGEGAGDRWPERAAALSAKVRDFSEFLAELSADGGPRATRHPLPLTVAYHDACHLANAQGIRSQPREMLRAIPDLEVTEIADTTCCGSAGVYNLLQPEAARDLGERKAAAVRATGAQLVVSGNPGCSLQIAAALTAQEGEAPGVAHIAEVLDASLRGLPPSALTPR
jgi:glycolate oxidase iron-sulfur subunit